MSLAIINGTIVTAESTAPGDILIEDGRIRSIGTFDGVADETIDASGHYVLPGGVDVHTHLDLPVQSFRSADDFRTGTIAAACGGTTTIVDFCCQDRGQTFEEAIGIWDEKAAGKSAVDYGYHMIVSEVTDGLLNDFAKLVARGITSIKLFMAYRGRRMVDDLAIIRALGRASELGMTVMVHAENGDAIQYLQQKALAEGKVEPRYHASTRPPMVEAEAVNRAIMLAEMAGTRIFIVHVSSRQALEAIRCGRARGVDVLAETCTHYLYTTQADLDRPDFQGSQFVFSPPGREKADQEALWQALKTEVLANVSSDHSASLTRNKMHGLNDFTRIPNGPAGIEERMAMLFKGVSDGIITANEFVRMTSTAPARLFGLYPRKGEIAPGSEADLVIWDPSRQFTIRNADLHHAVDYSLYEGQSVTGAPRDVLLRGNVIVRNGEYRGRPGDGQFLYRQQS